MSRARSVAAIRGYLSAQVRESAARGEGESRPEGPFVTISRQAGAQGTSTAEALAELLNAREGGGDEAPWTVFDKQLGLRVLEEHDLPKEYVAFLEERSVPGLRTAIEDYFGPQPSRRSMVSKTSETILHLAQLGHSIIVGRGGGFLTSSLRRGVRVRMIGTPEARVVRVMRYYKLPEDEAWEFMQQKDADRESYARTYFRKDIDDPLLYDLVMNMDDVEPPAAARVIAEALAIRRKS